MRTELGMHSILPAPLQVALQEQRTEQLLLSQLPGLMLSLLVRIRHKMVWLWSRCAVSNAVHS